MQTNLKTYFLRLIAYALDFFLLATVLVGVQFLVFALFPGFLASLAPLELYLWVEFTISIPAWLYFIVLESRTDQTLAKRWFKLKIVNRDGESATVLAKILRIVIRLLPWELTHASLIPIYLNPESGVNWGIWAADGLILLYLVLPLMTRGRTLHDLISGSMVKRLSF